jgi:aspartyl-tRNA(Asn)/glutamyl-tRNA(Gln) amidotransferase subunit A
MPIDPPYTGRAAGPMTRTVADAALMMQVLSQPDARDSMSLPYQPIDWAGFDAGAEQAAGLRIGLLLDAGCGLPVEPEVRAAVEQRPPAGAGRRPHGGTHGPFMTQDMLDGMDHFWRMRSYM